MLKAVHQKNNRFSLIFGILGAVLILSGVLCAPAASAQVINVGTEYQIKAAFIYNLAQFTEWPADSLTDSTENFHIGVLGSNPFGNYLDKIAREKLLKDRTIVIVYSDSISDVLDCQVVFISTSDKAVIGSIIQQLKDKQILTISDQAAFTRMGGIVNFINVQGKVRFAINLDAAKRAKLSLSTSLLKLAKIVGD